MEKTINKIGSRAWAVLGLACIAGVIFAGAGHHIWTAAICWIMYNAMKEEDG